MIPIHTTVPFRDERAILLLDHGTILQLPLECELSLVQILICSNPTNIVSTKLRKPEIIIGTTSDLIW